mgnify:CR=1 FL=1
MQVAPLLPYYDIDPEAVQFLSTGVIDDENFFSEPSLQGAIFPGVEKEKRSDEFLDRRYYSKISKSIAQKSVDNLHATIGEEERKAVRNVNSKPTPPMLASITAAE